MEVRGNGCNSKHCSDESGKKDKLSKWQVWDWLKVVSDQERGWEGKEGEAGKVQQVKFKEKKESYLI